MEKIENEYLVRPFAFVVFVASSVLLSPDKVKDRRIYQLPVLQYRLKIHYEEKEYVVLHQSKQLVLF